MKTKLIKKQLWDTNGVEEGQTIKCPNEKWERTNNGSENTIHTTNN